MVRTNTSGSRAVDVDAVSAFDVAGKAVLLHTGGDRDFGTPAYAEDAPFVTAAATKWLVAHDAALVDIDSVNIDDLVDPTRAHPPARRRDPSRRAPHRAQPEVPTHRARFTAAPPRFTGFGTFPVRAFAIVAD